MPASDTSITDAADLGVLEAAARLRSRQLSASELLAACERRIDARNGGVPTFEGAPDAVNAWARLYPDIAAEAARAADERLAREGAAAPLLCGIPLALKDLFAVAGLPLTASSRVLDGHVPDRDCVVWERLRRAGMVLVGHTHTHEFAAGGTTDQVGNPWATDRSAGGSSGGSAAALAARMVPAALGTDTAGSVRIPAALSGISSIKPTHGRIPIDGVIPLSPSMDHVGPMARTVADASAMLRALADGPAQVTPLMPPPAELAGLPLAPRPGDRPLAGTTIALTDRPDAFGLDPDVADGLAAARDACTALGATVIELTAPPTLDEKDHGTVFLTEIWSYHQRHVTSATHYRTSIRELVELSRTAGSAADYVVAQGRRDAITAAWEAWFTAHGVDLLLEPTVTPVAPPRGGGYDASPPGGLGDPLIVLTSTWNVTGFPVVALPSGVGRRSGLPVGASLVAARGHEASAVQAAIDLQAGPLPAPAPPPME